MAPARHRARPINVALRIDGRQGGLDESRRHAALAKLDPEPGPPIAAARPRVYPLEGEGAVVDVAAGHEIVDHGAGDILGGAAPPEAADQLGTRPGPTREEIGRGKARGPIV